MEKARAAISFFDSLAKTVNDSDGEWTPSPSILSDIVRNMETLDRYLVGHGPVGCPPYEGAARTLVSEYRCTLYLSDGGYSRIVVDLIYDGEHAVYPTLNMQPGPLSRWRAMVSE